MVYKASFEIQHGVAKGGLSPTYDDTITRKEDIEASNDIVAYTRAVVIADQFAMDYLSDSTGKTIVTITLKNPKGKEVDQANILRQACKEIDPKVLEETISSQIPNGKTIVERDLVEHLLALEA